MQTSEVTSSVRQGLIVRYIVAILRACHSVGGWIFIFMMLMTTVHIIGRYAFNSPLLGLIELSGFALTTSVFLLGAYVMVEKRHVTIGIIADHFSGKTQVIIDSATHVVGLVFVMVASWKTIQWGMSLTNTGRITSDVLLIPYYPFFIIVGIGWGLLGVAIVIRLVHLLSRGIKE